MSSPPSDPPVNAPGSPCGGASTPAVPDLEHAASVSATRGRTVRKRLPAPPRARHPAAVPPPRPKVRVQYANGFCTWWLASADGGAFQAVQRGRAAPRGAHPRHKVERWTAVGMPSLAPALDRYAAIIGCTSRELEDVLEGISSGVDIDGEHFDLNDLIPTIRAGMRLGPPEERPVRGIADPPNGAGCAGGEDVPFAPPALCELVAPIWLGDGGCGPTLLEAPLADRRVPKWTSRRWSRVVLARAGHLTVVWLWDGAKRYRVQLDPSAHIPLSLHRQAEPAVLLTADCSTQDRRHAIIVQGYATALGEMELCAAALPKYNLPWFFTMRPQEWRFARPMIGVSPIPDPYDGNKLEMRATCVGREGLLEIGELSAQLRRFVSATGVLGGAEEISPPNLERAEHAMDTFSTALRLGWVGPKRTARRRVLAEAGAPKLTLVTS